MISIMADLCWTHAHSFLGRICDKFPGVCPWANRSFAIQFPFRHTQFHWTSLKNVTDTQSLRKLKTRQFSVSCFLRCVEPTKSKTRSIFWAYCVTLCAFHTVNVLFKRCFIRFPFYSFYDIQRFKAILYFFEVERYIFFNTEIKKKKKFFWLFVTSETWKHQLLLS